jgi:hypothetical protein
LEDVAALSKALGLFTISQERRLPRKISIQIEVDFPSVEAMTDGQKENLEERVRYFADCYGMLDTGLQREISPSEVIIHVQGLPSKE